MTIQPTGRLVHVSTGLSLGGTERRLLELFEALRAREWHILLITLVNGAMTEAARTRGQPVESLSMRGRWDIRVLGSAFRVVNALQPDLLQSDAVRSHLVARYCAARIRRPHVSLVATDYWHDPVGLGRWRPFNQWLDLMTSGSSSAFLTSNRVFAERLWRYGIPAQRVHVVRHGIHWPDPDAIHAEGVQLRAQWGLTEDELLVVMVAMLRPQKRVEDLLAAWPSVRQAHPRAKLAIVGGVYAGQEGYVKKLRAQAGRLEIASHILWVGEVNSAYAWCYLADLVVLPSLSEGQPRSVLEAMAVGRPVVATDTVGTRAIVEHGVTGVLVPVNAPRELAQAMNTLLRDPQRRLRMGAAARQHVEQHHLFEAMVTDHEMVYRSLMVPRAEVC